MSTNLLYYVGFTKENFFFFSEETEVFSILKEILKEVDLKYSLFLESKIKFEISDIEIQKKVLEKLEKNILNLFEIEKIKGINVTAFFESEKKNISFKRDYESRKKRNLIMLYTTLHSCLEHTQKMIFFIHDSDARFKT